jgi:hypothetical protein
MAAGAAALLLLIFLVLHFHKPPNPAAQLAFKAERVDLVGRLQLGLASASEAEKSAVLATTDQESKAFADQARAGTAEVERERQELGELLNQGGTQAEKDLFATFSQLFTAFQRIDSDLLDLAVQNSNLKAYALAFGPAAAAIKEMNAALSRIQAANAESKDASKVMSLASGAEIGALRIQTLLAPHIAEASDSRMDDLEALMSEDEQQVRSDLEGLSALPSLKGDADLAIAATRYTDFRELKKQILALSRENTNVRSLFISLNQKRKVMLACQEALSTLEEAILQEPIEGVTYGRPAKPR